MKKIPIIYYHSVGSLKKDWNRNFLTLETHFFEDQIKYFSNKFNVISLSEYWEMKTTNIYKVNNPIVITFDDGYLDNWIWAFPILQKYKIKATIFICPEFVDQKNTIRPNLNDYWKGKAKIDELSQWGYLSWEEMQIMENSGLIDIQSHTMSHSKFIVSDKIISYHKPQSDNLYTILNKYPQLKPYHITEKNLSQLLPLGYPIFEEMSSVNAKRVEINQEFYSDCLESIKGYDFKKYNFNELNGNIGELHKMYLKNNNLVIKRETYEEYINRLKYEIIESKIIIEKKLNKEVKFLCWPHGDNNDIAHEIAIKSGYLATTVGNLESPKDIINRIPMRIGSSAYHNSRFLTLQRTKFKIRRELDVFPDTLIYKLYKKFKLIKRIH